MKVAKDIFMKVAKDIFMKVAKMTSIVYAT